MNKITRRQSPESAATLLQSPAMWQQIHNEYQSKLRRCLHKTIAFTGGAFLAFKVALYSLQKIKS
jgi:hypothetical protein